MGWQTPAQIVGATALSVGKREALGKGCSRLPSSDPRLARPEVLELQQEAELSGEFA